MPTTYLNDNVSFLVNDVAYGITGCRMVRHFSQFSLVILSASIESWVWEIRVYL